MWPPKRGGLMHKNASFDKIHLQKYLEENFAHKKNCFLIVAASGARTWTTFEWYELGYIFLARRLKAALSRCW